MDQKVVFVNFGLKRSFFQISNRSKNLWVFSNFEFFLPKFNDFRSKLQFSIKNSICHRNFDIWPKFLKNISTFWPKCLKNISTFWPKFRFYVSVSRFWKKIFFWPIFRHLTKIPIFDTWKKWLRFFMFLDFGLKNLNFQWFLIKIFGDFRSKFLFLTESSTFV